MTSPKEAFYKNPALAQKVGTLQDAFYLAVCDNKEDDAMVALRSLHQVFEEHGSPTPMYSLILTAMAAANTVGVDVEITHLHETFIPRIDELPEQIMSRVMHSGLGKPEVSGRIADTFARLEAELNAAP